jgi:hypothetical protein
VLSNEIGILLCLALLVLWLGIRREDRLVREHSCRHEWKLESLYNEGRIWYRQCDRCGKQIPVPGSNDVGPGGPPAPRRPRDRSGSRR